MAKAKIKPRPVFSIKDAAQLQQAAQNELAAFVQYLPRRMTFAITIKNSFVDKDGRRHKEQFAVLQVKVRNKRGTLVTLDELPLGTVPAAIAQPSQIHGDQVADLITQTVKQVQIDLPALPSAAPALPSAAPPPTIPRFDWPLGTTLSLRWFDRGNNKELTDTGTVSSYATQDTERFMRFTSQGGAVWIVFESDLKEAKSGASVPTMSGVPASSPASAPVPPQTTPPPTPISTTTAPTAPSSTSYPAATVFTGPPIPVGLFRDNEPYKYADNPTVYIFRFGLLSGVTSAQAFARFYGWTQPIPADLSTIHKINPMPNLTPYTVPSFFFQGANIS